LKSTNAQLTLSSSPSASVHRIRKLQRDRLASSAPSPLLDPLVSATYEKSKEMTARFESGSECGICCGEDPECICTICNCGNHRCPPCVVSVPYPDLKTEYQKKFKPWDGTDNRYRRPQDKPFSAPAAPDHWKTTNSNYKGHPIEPRSRPPKDPLSSSLPFEGVSTYRENFVPKEWDPKDAKKRLEAGPMLPFTGNTEHRTAYKGKPGDAASPFSELHKVPDTGPFLDSTEHKDAYQGRPNDAEPRKPSKAVPYKYGPNRNLKTGYQEDYPGHPGQLCPARLLRPKKPAHDCHHHFHFTGQFNSVGDPLYVG